MASSDHKSLMLSPLLLSRHAITAWLLTAILTWSTDSCFVLAALAGVAPERSAFTASSALTETLWPRSQEESVGCYLPAPVMEPVKQTPTGNHLLPKGSQAKKRWITECSRVLQLKDENVWLLLYGNAIKVHICLTYQFVTVIIGSWQGKERNRAFLTALGNRLVRASPQRPSSCRRVVSCVLFSVEIQQS